MHYSRINQINWQIVNQKHLWVMLAMSIWSFSYSLYFCLFCLLNIQDSFICHIQDMQRKYRICSENTGYAVLCVGMVRAVLTFSHNVRVCQKLAKNNEEKK